MREDWETTLTEAAHREGAELLSDEEVVHEMHFDSPDHFWQVWSFYPVGMIDCKRESAKYMWLLLCSSARAAGMSA